MLNLEKEIKNTTEKRSEIFRYKNWENEVEGNGQKGRRKEKKNNIENVPIRKQKEQKTKVMFPNGRPC